MTSPPTNQKNVYKLITPSLNHYYKTPHYPLQVGPHSLEGISSLWPPLPGKAIKLFFPTSPQTLSPRFNSVSGCRGRIQLHTFTHKETYMPDPYETFLLNCSCIESVHRKRELCLYVPKRKAKFKLSSFQLSHTLQRNTSI